MDLTTLIGIFAGVIVVFVGIIWGKEGINIGEIVNFYDISSIFITFGGSILMVVASTPIRVLKKIGSHMKIAFLGKKQDPMIAINAIVEYAQMARKSGLLALEEKANQETEPFLQSAILLIVDAVDSEKLRSMLENELENMDTRHAESISMYERGAAFGPAFGMIGTLIGLIKMLRNLNAGDADALAEGMSVALITTFYGSLFANIICAPIASKLQGHHDAEMLYKTIILEGVLSIQSGENPKYIREKLVSFLAQNQRTDVNKKDKGSSDDKE